MTHHGFEHSPNFSHHGRGRERAPQRDTAELDRHNKRFQGLAETTRNTSLFYEQLNSGVEPGEAFAAAALKIVEIKEANENLSSQERAGINSLEVIARLGGFIQAQQENDALSSQEDLAGYLTPEEKQRRRELKNEFLIPFNHSLKKYIDTHPNDSLYDTASALATTYSTQFSLDNFIGDNQEIVTLPEGDDTLMYIESALRGMRNELAAESILAAAGYEYDYNVSTTEDAAGADMFIRPNDKAAWMPLDVKASLMAANRERERARHFGFKSRAVWTGLHDGHYTGTKGDKPGSLSIPFSTAIEKSADFIKAIKDMEQHNRRARKSHRVAS